MTPKSDHDMIVDMHAQMDVLMKRTECIPGLCATHTADQKNLAERVGKVETAVVLKVSGLTFWSVIGILIGIPSLVALIIHFG